MAKKLTPKSATRALGRMRAGRVAVVPNAAETAALAADRSNKFPIASASDLQAPEERQLALFTPHPSALPLNAYLACALTGLNESARNTLFGLSDMVSQVCRRNGIDLYEPRKHTDPELHTEVPATEVYERDRARVLDSDLVVHLCHHPSTGAGEELEFARAALLPIVLIYPHEMRVSRMILGIPSLVVEVAYKTVEDLELQLFSTLLSFRPLLEERKLAFSKYNVNVVGEKIREIRQRLELSREDIEKASRRIKIERLRKIEESTDISGNPSLIELRELATLLKTTVADLVEPDLSQRIMAFLNTWVNDRAAARTSISEKDKNRILKTVLLRVVESLE